VLEVLDALYQACLEAQPWSRAAEQLEKRVGALVSLWLPFPQGSDRGHAIAPSIDTVFLRAYQERYHRLDPCAPFVASAPVGAVHDILSSTRPEREPFRRE
jgi:hypothetical protein